MAYPPASLYLHSRGDGTGTSRDPERPLFFDDFERSELLDKPAQLGYSYSGNLRTAIAEGAGYGGGHGCRFRYGPDDLGSDSSAELRLDKIPPFTREYCVRYFLYLPENFIHRTDGANNNKGIFQSWGGDYGGGSPGNTQQISFEYWPEPYNGWFSPGAQEGESYLTMNLARDGNKDGHRGHTEAQRGGSSGTGSMFRFAERGRWMQWKVHVKLASAPGQQDGELRVWKWVEGEAAPELVYDYYSIPAPSLPEDNYIDSIYLLGWANSGFAEETQIVIDRLAIGEALLPWEAWQ